MDERRARNHLNPKCILNIMSVKMKIEVIKNTVLISIQRKDYHKSTISFGPITQCGVAVKLARSEEIAAALVIRHSCMHWEGMNVDYLFTWQGQEPYIQPIQVCGRFVDPSKIPSMAGPWILTIPDSLIPENRASRRAALRAIRMLESVREKEYERIMAGQLTEESEQDEEHPTPKERLPERAVSPGAEGCAAASLCANDFETTEQHIADATQVLAAIVFSCKTGREMLTRLGELSNEHRYILNDRISVFSLYRSRLFNEYIRLLLWIGAKYRAEENERGVDGEGWNEDIVFSTIKKWDGLMCEEGQELLDLLYSMEVREVDERRAIAKHAVEMADGSVMELNEQQSKAVELYRDGRRFFCIQSPPGSGKTMVAAVMASMTSGTQLVLSTQNEAVDALAGAIKKVKHNHLVYNMKSFFRFNPVAPAPYELMESEAEKAQVITSLWADRMDALTSGDQVRMRQCDRKMDKECSAVRDAYECGSRPRIILSTVDLVLHRMRNGGSKNTKAFVDTHLSRVASVIVDEASMLSESALIALISVYPTANFVLVGDVRQLGPFLYEAKSMGHELAGRPALSVAMRNGGIPVVELNEVYRAPQSIVQPYNRLAYGGRLVSRIAEGATPLTDVGLVPRGSPQLLFVGVDGGEMRNDDNHSWYNMQEVDALIRILKKFEPAMFKAITVITLYSEQRDRVVSRLGVEFSHNTNDRLVECPVTVTTIDGSQGKENSIIFVLTTRTDNVNEFFGKVERCTVAISRPKEALVILGNVKILTQAYPWSEVSKGGDFHRIESSDLQ